jgi:uncharacterized cysteine cluster protein YcgN (CxxCxxCC family)
MGLLSIYIASKYGQNKTAKKVSAALAEAETICDHCGHPLYRHAPDARRTCPIYVTVS